MLDQLRERYRGRTWVPVTLGMSGARVWRVDGGEPVYVKTTEHARHGDRGDGLAAEAQRLIWLGTHGIRVPEVLDLGMDEQFGWLVTSGLRGRTAADPWPEARRAAVVDALAEVALALHALPVADCGFDRRLAAAVPAALHAAETGALARRWGDSASQHIDELVRTVPHTEDPVVCHGDFCLPNVLFDEETLEFTGVVDVGPAGLADRHCDIALITRSLAHSMNPQYGEAYAQRFITTYEQRSGLGVDPAKIAFYRLLDEF